MKGQPKIYYLVILLIAMCVPRFSYAQIVSDSFSGSSGYLDAHAPTTGYQWSSRSTVNSGAGTDTSGTTTLLGRIGTPVSTSLSADVPWMGVDV